jgi:hypothetical protein
MEVFLGVIFINMSLENFEFSHDLNFRFLSGGSFFVQKNFHFKFFEKLNEPKKFSGNF